MGRNQLRMTRHDHSMKSASPKYLHGVIVLRATALRFGLAAFCHSEAVAPRLKKQRKTPRLNTDIYPPCSARAPRSPFCRTSQIPTTIC